jgi:hypothetical protein
MTRPGRWPAGPGAGMMSTAHDSGVRHQLAENCDGGPALLAGGPAEPGFREVS